MTTDQNIDQAADQTTDQSTDLVTGRRNFALNVANGVGTHLAMNLTHPSLVLSVFVRSLGGSNALVGSLSAIRFGGWFLPQFFAAGWVQPLRRKTPLALALELGRIVIYALLGILTYTLGPSNPTLLLVVFFLLFTISRFSAGIGALARTDIFAKTIPPERRAGFFAQRNLWGRVAVFGAGFVVSYVLDDSPGWRFPANFTLLFALSTLTQAAAGPCPYPAEGGCLAAALSSGTNSAEHDPPLGAVLSDSGAGRPGRSGLYGGVLHVGHDPERLPLESILAEGGAQKR